MNVNSCLNRSKLLHFGRLYPYYRFLFSPRTNALAYLSAGLVCKKTSFMRLTLGCNDKRYNNDWTISLIIVLSVGEFSLTPSSLTCTHSLKIRMFVSKLLFFVDHRQRWKTTYFWMGCHQGWIYIINVRLCLKVTLRAYLFDNKRPILSLQTSLAYRVWTVHRRCLRLRKRFWKDEWSLNYIKELH